MNRRLLHTYLFVISLSFFGFSQDHNNLIPLTSLLSEVETKFNVKFSYSDKDISSVKISRPNSELSLQEVLNYIELRTSLELVILDSRFIVIKKNLSKTKPQQLQQLEEVVIQNYLTQGLAKTVNGTIEISPQKLGILPGLSEPDILQTIQALPGIKSVDERISNINIRGGTNDQNLVLYEGIRMYQTGHFFGLISAFNPYLTSKVNVTINGTKAKYGSGVSSLISIENTDIISNNSEFGTGFNLISVDGYSKFQPTSKTEVQIAARRSYTDALSTPTYDNYFQRVFTSSQFENNQSVQDNTQQNENFFFYDASFKFLYDINENQKLRINAITIYNKLGFSEDILNQNNIESSESALSQQSYAFNLKYSHNWSPSLLMDAQLYYSNYQLFGNNRLLPTTQELTQENEVIDIGFRLDFLKQIDSKLKLNYGYQFNEVGVTNLEDVTLPRFRSFIKEVIKTHGLYSEAEFQSNSKNTYARIGLRGNYIEKFDTFLFEPRFSFSQKFLNSFRIEILGEQKSQSITQIIDLQQDFFGIEKRRWQLSDNTEVPIVKSNQISLGLSYKRKGWLINAEGYIKNVMGISTRSQGFQNQFQLIDTFGDYNVRGVDVLVDKRFKNFNIWLGYSFSKNQYNFDTLNNGESFPNNIDIRHIFSFSTSYEIENFKLSTGINWNSGRPFTQPAMNQLTSGTINFEQPNANRIPDYLRADISARYNFKFAPDVNAEVGFSIWNIFNNENIVNRFFTRDPNDAIIETNEIALGLTPNFSFRLKF